MLLKKPSTTAVILNKRKQEKKSFNLYRFSENIVQSLVLIIAHDFWMDGCMDGRII